MKLNIEIANFLDHITSKLKWNVSIKDNGKTMWVYDYDDHKRYSITNLVHDILVNGNIQDVGLGLETTVKLCSILPRKNDRELAFKCFINDSDLI